MKTVYEVIKERQEDIAVKVQNIVEELEELRAASARLLSNRDELQLEYDLLCKLEEQNLIVQLSADHDEVKTTGDKVLFEDALTAVFRWTDGTMRMYDLIRELNKFGYVWSSYESAHSQISKHRMVEKVKGKRGYYQLK